MFNNSHYKVAQLALSYLIWNQNAYSVFSPNIYYIAL